MQNHFTQLRQQRLAQATRPFKARGISVSRCPRCLLAENGCICPWRRQADSNIAFCLLMHDSEPLKPSNTGRLIADVLPETRAFLWRRTGVDEQLLALLEHPDWFPVIVFPAAFSTPDRVVTRLQAPECPEGRRPLLILLDGTWQQARKMFRKSPYLDRFPVLSLQTDANSRYLLRKRETPGQLCTAEVAYQLLAEQGERQAAQVLQAYFSVFNQHYQALRDTRVPNTDSDDHAMLASIAVTGGKPKG